MASAVILTLGQFSAVLAQCAVEIQKNTIFIRMFLGTFLVNDYKPISFSHAHSGLQSYREQKPVKSYQIMSKATIVKTNKINYEIFSKCVSDQQYPYSQKRIFFPPHPNSIKFKEIFSVSE